MRSPPTSALSSRKYGRAASAACAASPARWPPAASRPPVGVVGPTCRSPPSCGARKARLSRVNCFGGRGPFWPRKRRPGTPAAPAVPDAAGTSAAEEDFKHGAFEQGLLRRVCCVPTRRSVSVLDLLYLFQVDHRALGGTVFLEPFSLAELGGYFNDVTMRDLGLDLSGRQIRHAFPQQDFNGADLRDREFELAHGAGLQPIDKLTRSDFFPDIIGMEEHFAFGHLFRLLHAYSTG